MRSFLVRPSERGCSGVDGCSELVISGADEWLRCECGHCECGDVFSGRLRFSVVSRSSVVGCCVLTVAVELELELKAATLAPSLTSLLSLFILFLAVSNI